STTAADKNQVLPALGKLASDIRGKLGESLGSIQKHSASLEQATTTSLDALKSYTMGRETLVQKGDSQAAVPFFQRAIALDPNFAMAYASLGTVYSNLNMDDLSKENMRKANDLRDRVSDREKFYISSHYEEFVTGDMEKTLQIYELWKQTYPSDAALIDVNLCNIDIQVGYLEKGLPNCEEGERLDPGGKLVSGNLIETYFRLGRTDEARAVIERDYGQDKENPAYHGFLMQLAGIQHDPAGVQKQVEWYASKPFLASVSISIERAMDFAHGQFAKGSALFKRQIDSTDAVKNKDARASLQKNLATMEMLFGYDEKATQDIRAALATSPTSIDTEATAAILFGYLGDLPRQQSIVDDLNKRFPENSSLQKIALPTSLAAAAYFRKDYAKAIDILQPLTDYELGGYDGMDSTFFRGLVYLRWGKFKEAAAEYQRILDHPGVVGSSPEVALSRLGLARAKAGMGDVAGARTAYQDLFAAWKDADPDLPPLVAARSEYAKLQ
ncbi:MAG TPA: tetratricopeptide repeat protein, partial [Candidatus Acidoferrum sp.]|nr:tetratricopeptide repeat protein [Candidatus Acidoferrum sp.]